MLVEIVKICSHHSPRNIAMLCYLLFYSLCIVSQHSGLFFTTLCFQAGRNVRDLFEDLRDGHNLLSLLEMLSGEILVSRRCINIHLLINCQPIPTFLIMQLPGLGHDDHRPDDACVPFSIYHNN